MRFKVLEDCYYGEKGRTPRIYEKGDYYDSDTLLPEQAPPYFQPIGIDKPIPKTSGAVKPGEGDTELGMTYQEMKAFVAEKGIEVPDHRKDTLVNAILDYKTSNDENEEETEVETEE